MARIAVLSMYGNGNAKQRDGRDGRAHPPGVVIAEQHVHNNSPTKERVWAGGPRPWRPGPPSIAGGACSNHCSRDDESRPRTVPMPVQKATGRST